LAGQKAVNLEINLKVLTEREAQIEKGTELICWKALLKKQVINKCMASNALHCIAVSNHRITELFGLEGTL